MFMHGPPTHCSCECVDIWFVYVRRMSSPGLTRMTGGSSRPSKRKAAFPVCGSLIAVKFTGERASGALGSRLDGETLLGFAGLCANRYTLQSKPKHVTRVETFRLAI